MHIAAIAPQPALSLLDPVTEEIVGIRRVRVSRLPFRLLARLAAEPGRVVSCDELTALLWPRRLPAYPRQRLGDVVWLAREALADAQAGARVVRVKDVGLRLEITE